MINLAENALSAINGRLVDYYEKRSKREMAGKHKGTARVDLQQLFNYPAPTKRKSNHVDK